jgi:uncharacterized protein YegP (UPF0339 family)
MDTVHFFTDETGEWRWHRKSENGEIVSESGEGYVELDDARNQVISQFGDDVRLAYDEPDDKSPTPDQENPAETPE